MVRDYGYVDREPEKDRNYRLGLDSPLPTNIPPHEQLRLYEEARGPLKERTPRNKLAEMTDSATD